MKLFIAISLLASVVFADTWVNGYMTSNGTWVNGYWRADANSTKNDNYSTDGNTNPYTGSNGYKPSDYACYPKWVYGYTDNNGRYHSGHMSSCN